MREYVDGEWHFGGKGWQHGKFSIPMKVFISGADGFIGSHLVEELVFLGYQVKAFVQYNTFNSWGWLDKSNPEIKGQFEVICGDIRDPHSVKSAMSGCDSVIHLAALISIPYSYISPDAYLDTNIRGTLNILQAARDLRVNRLIHTSSSEVYGTAKFVPITEDHPLQGQSPYSATKIAADQLAYSFFNSFDLPVVIVRPFNTFGPRQSARAVIPTIVTQIANKVRKIKLGALTPTRDFSYVQDTVGGFISALKSQKGVGEIINLGSGFEISIGDTAKLILNLMSSNCEIVMDENRVRPKGSEVERLFASNSKAKDILGWCPKYEGLDGFKKGLIQTIEWFTKPENLINFKHEIYNL